MENGTSKASHFSGLRFRKAADPALTKAASAESCRQFQAAWRSLTSRVRKQLNRRLEQDTCSALWSADVLATSPTDRELAATLEAWLRGPAVTAAARGKAASAATAAEIPQVLLAALRQEASPFVVLSAAEFLLRRPEAFTAEAFVELWQLLAAVDPDHWNHLAPPSEPETAQAVSHAVAHGEIPWLLGLLLSPLKSSRTWLRQGRKVLRQTLDDATDTDGTVHACVTERLGEWLAPLVRATAWGTAFGQNWQSSKDARRWKEANRQSAGLLCRAGIATELTKPLPAHDRTASVRILQQAAVLADFSASSPVLTLIHDAAADLASPGKSKRRRTKTTGKQRNRSSSTQSDWAALAVLRSGLQLTADVATLSWNAAVTALSLSPGGEPLLAGGWQSTATVGSQTLEPGDEWACSCWFQDKEVAFVELTCELTSEIQLVRHLVLSHTDHFAILCDSLRCPDSAQEIQLTSRLPLVSAAPVRTDSVSRELWLQAGQLAVRAVPAWLADDRVQYAAGNCQQEGHQFVLTGDGLGGVTLPLVLDWQPSRQVREADWNRLTVTENRIVQTHQQAAGFRVRIGRLQLLLYRSLQPGQTLRAVLGHHTGHETVYGHVRNSGDIDPLVLVDSEVESETDDEN